MGKQLGFIISSETGQSWFLSRRIPYESYEAYYAPKEGTDFDPEVPDDELIDWLQNNMNWSEFSDHLVELTKPDPVDPENEWPNMDIEPGDN